MPSLILAALTAFALLLAPAPAAAAQSAPPAHTIPFDLYGNRIYVKVSGPGFGHSWFLLDTGAQITHYTMELVEQAKLRTTGSIGITGTGPDRVPGRRVAGTGLRIGSLTFPVAGGIAAPAEALFGNIYSGSGRRFEGVIGYDLFAAYVVEIDYQQRVLRLHDKGSYRAPATAALPIRIVDKKPYMTGVMAARGTLPLAANLHLDTGFGGALSLNGRYVAQQRLVERVGPTLGSLMQGVGGATEARVGRLERLQLGPIALPGPIVSLALAQGAGVRSDSAGRIGGDILRRFTVTLDYARRLLWLEPNSSFGEPFETDMSGLTIAAAAPAAGLAISQVAQGTPAALAGVRPGDQLLAIDGKLAASLTLDEIRSLLRKHGETRRLRLLRDGREVEVEFVLRRRL